MVPITSQIIGSTSRIWIGSTSAPSSKARGTTWPAARSAGVGDVNGDGYADFLIGARQADAASEAKSEAGESYLIYGSAALPTSGGCI